MDTVDEKINTVLKPVLYSRGITVSRFVILSIATFGIYNIIWFYRTWKLLREELSLQIQPLARAYFSVFFGVSFGKNIQILLEKNSLKTDFDPMFLGISYLLLTLFGGILPTPFWLVAFCAFVPLVPFVEALNAYYIKVDGALPEKKFSPLQQTLIGIGMLGVVLIIIGAFFIQI